MRTTKREWHMKMRRKNMQQRKRQDVRREDNKNKRKTKNRNVELRASSLGPKPFLLFWGVLILLFHWCWDKKLFSAEKEGISVNFWVSPFVLSSLSHFPFLLSLSYVIILPSSFLVFFICSFPCFFFLPCLLLLFHAKKNISILYSKGCSHQFVNFVFWVSCFCLVFEIIFCYICFLLWPHLT